MARGDSIIRVSIIGDAKKLVTAMGEADTATGGLLKSSTRLIGSSLIAFGLVDAAFETIKGGLANADKLADAITRIEGATTPAFASRIHDIAFDFTRIGLSAPEFATLAAQFADFATSAGISEPLIESITPDLVTIAAAIAATTGKTVDEVITDIGKAAQGSQKPVADLGVVIDTTLNPDDQITSILEQLKAKFPDVITATGDLAGKQATLNAKWDNFTTKLGEALEGPLGGVLDVFNNILEDLPQLDTDFRNLAGAVATILSPLARLVDLMNTLAGININNIPGQKPFTLVEPGRAPRGSPGSGPTDAQTAAAVQRQRERNGLGR